MGTLSVGTWSILGRHFRPKWTESLLHFPAGTAGAAAALLVAGPEPAPAGPLMSGAGGSDGANAGDDAVDIPDGAGAESQGLIDGDPTPAELFSYEWKRTEIILEGGAIIASVIFCCCSCFCLIAVILFYAGNWYFILRERSTPFDAPRGQNWESDWDATLERISTPHTLTWHVLQYSNLAYKEAIRFMDQLHLADSEVGQPPLPDIASQTG